MAQPALAEVRVSCPACGGAVHPIAGRCKHCKADLVTARGGATAALGTVVQLGSLGGAPAAGSTSSPVSVPLVAGPAGAAAPIVDAPTVVVAPAAAPPRRKSWRRHWPLAVVGLAAIAILVSIGILFLGGDGEKKSRRRRALGPAPDRMQTDQLPTDPFAQPGPGSQHQPLPQVPPPDVDPDQIAPGPTAPPDDPDDPSGGVVGGMVAPSASSAFLGRALDIACERLTTCWGAPAARQMCDQLRIVGEQTFDSADSCPRFDQAAADRCLDKLAHVPCPDDDASAHDLFGMAVGFDDCLRVCM